MSDLISRADAIGVLMETIAPPSVILDTLVMRIDALPSAEARPTGEWIQKDMYADRFCSECNYAVWDSEAEEYNFCPNCGADMRGEKHE